MRHPIIKGAAFALLGVSSILLGVDGRPQKRDVLHQKSSALSVGLGIRAPIPPIRPVGAPRPAAGAGAGHAAEEASGGPVVGGSRPLGSADEAAEGVGGGPLMFGAGESVQPAAGGATRPGFEQQPVPDAKAHGYDIDPNPTVEPEYTTRYGTPYAVRTGNYDSGINPLDEFCVDSQGPVKSVTVLGADNIDDATSVETKLKMNDLLIATWHKDSGGVPPSAIQRINISEVFEDETEEVMGAVSSLRGPKYTLESTNPDHAEHFNLYMTQTTFGKSVQWMNDLYIGKSVSKIEVENRNLFFILE